MSVTAVRVKTREYSDSVRLMQLSSALRGMDGVTEAILLMATDNNKRLLDGAGLLQGAAVAATANDLVIVVVAADQGIADSALERAETLLRQRSTSDAATSFRTLDSALQALPGAALALISVPGPYAASEARRALERGLHVMLFSDNVPLEDEISLKRMGRERGLMVMGPDCGTAILHGAGLGFANRVRRGSVGIVGASGTGIQEISVLVDRLGAGISHAIGTGGRDLKEAVGGATMLMGIDWLEDDPATAVIVVTSKPPSPAVARRVVERLERCAKPVVVNFLGGEPIEAGPGIQWAATLEDAASQAVRLAGGEPANSPMAAPEQERLANLAQLEAARFAPGQRFLRGLFTGGTLGYEALLVLRETLGDVYSNIPLRPELRLTDAWHTREHSLLDLGDDEFTQGRAHPMIDPTLRQQMLGREAADPEVAVILLDVVLGLGSHANPAESVAGVVQQAIAAAASAGRHLSVVASVCGTITDPQDLTDQERQLSDAGVLVCPTNAQAARLAGLISRALSLGKGGDR